MSKQLTARIGEALEERLEGFRYLKSQEQLTRQIAGGSQSIAIGVLSTSRPGFAKLAAHGHIRLDAIEAAYTPHHPYLSTADAKTHPTIVVNCDTLLTDPSLAHRFATDEPQIITFINAFALALKADVLPWLERYSDEQRLYANLDDDDPINWITSDRLTRYPVLLAILARRGNWTRFEQISAEFQRYCEQPHAQVYAPLAQAIIKGLAV